MESAVPDPVSSRPCLGDPEIVIALGAKSPTALGAVYEAYSERLYTYALSIVRKPEIAADVTHDTVLLAYERIDQLRDPLRFKAWMYAICRNLCLRDVRVNAKSVSIDGGLAVVPELPDVSVNIDGELSRGDARELVAAALSGMSAADREIMELALRHNLEASQVANVLGVSEGNARSRLARCRSQLEAAVGALLLFRQRNGACPEMDQISSVGEFTPLIRKRITRHLATCEVCSKSRKRAVRAVAMAGLPLIPIPLALREAAQPSTELTAWATTSGSGPSTSAMIRFDASGWPAAVSAATKPALGVLAGAAAAVAVGLAVVIGMVVGKPGDLARAGTRDAHTSVAIGAVQLGVLSAIAAPPEPAAAKKPIRRKVTSPPERGTSVSESNSPEVSPTVKAEPNPPMNRPRPKPTRTPTESAAPVVERDPVAEPEPIAEPPTDDCWRYDPGAGEDYLPGGAPPECL